MLLSSLSNYRCPADHSPLELRDAEGDARDVVAGTLVSAAGRRYPIARGIPNLIFPETLGALEAGTKEEYDRVAERIYDAALDWQFAALYENEETVRETMLDMLAPQPGQRVLEVGCGTGRDSYRLARRLGDGSLFLQDLSPNMVYVCRDRMADYRNQHSFSCALEYSISNATHLPFPDNFFDSVFHFGGFNQFGDLKAGAAEFARVVKPGGRVLFGDESVGPWLKGTEFEKIVTTNNRLFDHDLPLYSLPECARNVSVRWLMANCFYVIAFDKGEGTPPLNLDLPHAGWRGGSMRTRYFGVMEGVNPETKALAQKAAASTGKSIHQWLDDLVREQAARDIENKK